MAFIWRGLLVRRQLSVQALYGIDMIYGVFIGISFGASAALSEELRPAAYAALVYGSFTVFTRAARSCRAAACAPRSSRRRCGARWSSPRSGSASPRSRRSPAPASSSVALVFGVVAIVLATEDEGDLHRVTPARSRDHRAPPSRRSGAQVLLGATSAPERRDGRARHCAAAPRKARRSRRSRMPMAPTRSIRRAPGPSWRREPRPRRMNAIAASSASRRDRDRCDASLWKAAYIGENAINVHVDGEDQLREQVRRDETARASSSCRRRGTSAADLASPCGGRPRLQGARRGSALAAGPAGSSKSRRSAVGGGFVSGPEGRSERSVRPRLPKWFLGRVAASGGGRSHGT